MLKDAGSWGLIVVNDEPEGIILIWVVEEYIYINSFSHKIELKGMQGMAHASAQTGSGSNCRLPGKLSSITAAGVLPGNSLIFKSILLFQYVLCYTKICVFSAGFCLEAEKRY